MNFGLALESLRSGLAVTREGWNGKGMFLFLIVDWHALPVSNDEDIARANALGKQPFIAMKTASGTLVPWLASQSDILAEDWYPVC